MRILKKMFRVPVLMALLLTGTRTYAYDLHVRGVYYNRLSPNHVEVTFKDAKKNDDAYSGDVVIPERVRTMEGQTYEVISIGDKAFSSCWKMTSLTLPESIMAIGEDAFTGCIGLTKLSLPSKVAEIGSRAFAFCTELLNITIPEGVVQIKAYTFLACAKLASVRLPSSIRSIEESAFDSCEGLTRINLPEGLKIIGNRAFSGSSALRNIILPGSLYSMGERAFDGSGLTAITIPGNIGEIHPTAFDNCRNLKDLKMRQLDAMGQIGGHEWVDLGLPSGLKWATCNLGALTPEESGKYYSWGELANKAVYDSEKAKVAGSALGDISGRPAYDAAAADWGGSWRMPTKEEFLELIENCRLEHTELNGQPGIKLTSKSNYRSIFFPAAGLRRWASLERLDAEGYYWTSSQNEKYDGKASRFCFSCTFGFRRFDDDAIGYGMNIRPVSK